MKSRQGFYGVSVYGQAYRVQSVMNASTHMFHLPVIFLIIGVVFANLSSLFAGQIHDAVKSGDANTVRSLLKSDSTVAKTPQEGGVTPLHLAMTVRSRVIAEMLLAAGADVNAKTANGATPLHWAVIANSRDMAAWLVEHGADIALRTNDGLTALDIARLKNYSDVAALLSAGRKENAGVARVDSRFAEATKAMEKGDGAVAFGILMQLFREHPGDPELNLALGQAAFVAGKYSHATLAFERLVRMDPENDRARLELAKSYYAARQYSLSRDEFETVLAHNPPPNVRKNIGAFLALIEKTEQRSGFGARLDFGLFNDDNANIGPNSSVIETSLQNMTITLDETSLPIKSFGQYLATGVWGHYDPGRKGRWIITWNGTGYKSWLKKEVKNRETLYAGINAGVQRGEQKYLLRIPAKVEYLALGGDRLMNIYGIAPSYMRSIGNSRAWYMTAQAAVESRKYATLVDRNGPYYALGCEIGRYFKKPAAMMSGGINAFYENTEAGAYRNKGGEVSLNGEIGTICKIVAYGRLKYRIARYAEPEPLAPEARRDNQLQATIGFRRPVAESWSVDVNYQRTSNNSTFDLHEYRRNVVTIGASYIY